jgi:hypothetical protein
LISKYQRERKMNLGQKLLNKITSLNKRLTHRVSKIPGLLSHPRTFIGPGKATVISGGLKMKKNTPTTKLLLFFSWTVAVLSAAIAAYVFLSGGVTPTALAKAVLAMLGGLIAATVLRAFANISQLVFDIHCNLLDSLRALHKNEQDITDQCRQGDRNDPGSCVTIGKPQGHGE